MDHTCSTSFAQKDPETPKEWTEEYRYWSTRWGLYFTFKDGQLEDIGMSYNHQHGLAGRMWDHCDAQLFRRYLDRSYTVCFLPMRGEPGNAQSIKPEMKHHEERYIEKLKPPAAVTPAKRTY
jgi:hypothetical protein